MGRFKYFKMFFRLISVQMIFDGCGNSMNVIKYFSLPNSALDPMMVFFIPVRSRYLHLIFKIKQKHKITLGWYGKSIRFF